MKKIKNYHSYLTEGGYLLDEISPILKKLKAENKAVRTVGWCHKDGWFDDWKVGNLKVQYGINMDIKDPSESVEIRPFNFIADEAEDLVNTYTFNIGERLLASVDKNHGWDYGICIPQYKGLLDDEHTSKGRIPTIDRKQFAQELEKIIRASM